MTPLFPAQRAAEEFDRVLGGTAPRAVTDRYAELLDTVTTLRERPEVTPREDFVGDLRSRLMAAAETELVPASPVVRRLDPTPTSATAHRRRLGTLAASLVIVGGTAGMAAAATGSMPGDSLYPVKIGLEQADTAVRFGEAAKGRSLLDQAATRLDEVSRLQADPNPDTALIAATVESFREKADSGSGKLFKSYQAEADPEDIEAVRTFTAGQMADVDKLSSNPGGSDPSLVDAADTLADIDQQARVLCDACGPAQGLALPGALSSGSRAATMDDLLAQPVIQAQAAITAAEAAQLERFRERVERNADNLPPSPRPQQAPVPGAEGGPPGEGHPTPPVPAPPGDGATDPGTSKPAAPSASTVVKDLVSGVTGTLDALTGAIAPGTGLSRVVDGLTDSLDKTVDGLTRPRR